MVNIIIYAILALGAVTFVGSVVHKYNTAIEGKVAAEKELKSCGDKYATVLGQIKNQNDALKNLTIEKNKAQALSEKAVALAKMEAARNKPERDRLAVLEQTFKSTGTCPAGEAVSEIRKGLRP